MKKWEHILKYRPPFLVYTDAASLKYIMNLKSEETIFQHWYAELAQFEFIVIHKKGSENVNADALSRAKHLDEPTTEENEEYQEANEVDRNHHYLIHHGVTKEMGELPATFLIPEITTPEIA